MSSDRKIGAHVLWYTECVFIEMYNGTVSKRNLNILLVLVLALATAVLYLNKIALEQYYYWLFWWYDVMMHFLGGLTIGSAALWAQARLAHVRDLRTRTVLITTMCIVVIVGSGWEIFEYATGLYALQANIVFDTVKDLVMDTLGGAVAWVGIRSIVRSVTQ